MICDGRSHLLLYRGLSPRLDLALRYLAETDFSGLGAGRYPVDGDAVFALVQEPRTAERGECRWESHRRYLDIQYLLAGQERIGFQNAGALAVAEPYDAGRDIAFYRDNGRGFFAPLEAGSFVVCFPHDAHMPLVCGDGPQQIRKVVMKVMVSEPDR